LHNRTCKFLFHRNDVEQGFSIFETEQECK